MNGFLKVGTILCWAVAIGSEYVAQKWPNRKKFLNIFAGCMFALALFGEYQSYRYDSAEIARMQHEIDATGIPEEKWFMAKDADKQDFEIPDIPIDGKVGVLVNGLIEPNETYLLNGKIITLMMRLNHTDQVTIQYQRHR